MSKAKVIYCGRDRVLAERLKSSTERLGAEYEIWKNEDIHRLSTTRNFILLLEEDIRTSLPYDDLLEEDQQYLVVYLISPEVSEVKQAERNEPETGRNFLIKTENNEILNAQLNLYLQVLAQRRAEQDITMHALLKKNRKLSQQIMHLQERLYQLDSDRQSQEEVLGKIEKISQLSRQVNCLDQERIATVCIESIPKLIAARFASLYTFDDNKGVLHLLRHNHPYMIDRLVVLEQHQNSPMAVAIRNKQLMLIHDLGKTEDNKDHTVRRLYARNYASNSCIIAPLLSGDKILGVLNLADKMDGPHFDKKQDLPPIQLLCEIIGSAFSNIKLYEEVRKQARQDGMTGLVNHRTFYDELNKEIVRSRRYGGNLSLIMIDLDDLKQKNDVYGHRAGDAVITHVANQIKSCTREIDIAARYGGDEFAIILPNTSVSDAMCLAERLLELVHRRAVEVDETTLQVSVSIGLGQYRPDLTIEDFMNQSDAALFEAKTAGKNRIHVFEYSDGLSKPTAGI